MIRRAGSGDAEVASIEAFASFIQNSVSDYGFVICAGLAAATKLSTTMKQSHFVIILLLVMLAAVGVWGRSEIASEPSTSVLTIYSNGRAYNVPLADPRFPQFQTLMETVAADSPDGPYEEASKDELTAAPGMAIELVSVTPIRLRIHYWFLKSGHLIPVMVDRILVRLSGDHAGWNLSGLGSYDRTPAATVASSSFYTLLALTRNELDILRNNRGDSP